MTLTNLTGIIGIEYAFPKYYVTHNDLANYFTVDPHKYSIGLNLTEMSVPCDGDDVVSLALTAVNRLLKTYKIDQMSVGRIEVGTESNFDLSKSVKSFLMDLFPENNNIFGIDNVNACYGGTNALFNALFYMESPFYDGRYCIVVCTDIAKYQEDYAIPTSGGGAVAILLGKDPVFVLEHSMYHHFANDFDFYKPVDNYPFPVFDRFLSLDLYKASFKNLFDQVDTDFDYICMHTPYPKLPVKAIQQCNIDIDKLEPSLCLARRNGNSYTASLYFCLLSLITEKKGELKIGDKILMFSYGSGVASSIFFLKMVSNSLFVHDLEERLNERKRICVRNYVESVLSKSEMKDLCTRDKSDVKDAFYLENISNFKRYYGRNN